MNGITHLPQLRHRLRKHIQLLLHSLRQLLQLLP
jgi:hypothetical protein